MRTNLLGSQVHNIRDTRVFRERERRWTPNEGGRGGELLSRKSERNACTRGSTWQPELGPGSILPLVQESFSWRMCAHAFVRSCWDAFLPSLSPDICAALISNKMMHRQQDAQSSSSNGEFAMYPSAVYHSSCSTPLSSTSSSSRSSSTTCPFLLSVLTWSLTFLLISSCIGLGADAATLNGHPLGKRSFFDIQCKGVYDKSIFARLDRICEDCYNLFREPQLHMLCKKECFTTDYFKGCLDVLLLTDEVGKIQRWIKQLHGADPGV